MASNDSSQHSDGEEAKLTDEQRATIDRIQEILAGLPPSRMRAFAKYLKELADAEEGCKEGDNPN